MQLGSGAQTRAVEDRQTDRNTDALLDADEGDDHKRDDRQPELEQVEAGDRPKISEMEDPSGDEDEHGGERGQGHVLQEPRGGNEQHERGRCT